MDAVRFCVLLLFVILNFLWVSDAQEGGVINCADNGLTAQANELCRELFGLGISGQTITWNVSEDSSEITYVAPSLAFRRTLCTRANLNLTGVYLLSGEEKIGFARDSQGDCQLCEGNSFCQSDNDLLSECICETCSRNGQGGLSFRGNFDNNELPVQCGRCPFSCSSLGLELMPSGGDSCIICNEELSIPSFDQDNCLTLEGWWVEEPITIEELRNAKLNGPQMLYSTRIKKCFPNPDAWGRNIKDSLGLRAKAGQSETVLSHCKRNSLIYPSANFTLASYESADERCVGVATGALCLGCEEGYTKRGSFYGNCTECTSLDEFGFAAKVIMNIGIIVASVYFTLKTERAFRRNKGEPAENAFRLTVWKIWLSHLQMLSAFAFLAIPWEPATISFMTLGEYFAVSRIDLSCIYPTTFYSNELVFILLFWFLTVAGTFLVVFVRHLYRRRGCDLCALEERTMTKELDKEVLCSKIEAAIVAAILAMHFMCTSTTLQLLSCVSLDYENAMLTSSWLLKDPKLRCWDGPLGAWQFALGIPFLFIFLILIPLYLCWIIKKRQLAFLTYFYKKDHAYWDVVILARKVFFLFCVVLLTDYGPAVETSNASLVLGLSLLVHCYYLPYSSAVANFLDGSGLLVLMFTLSLGSFQSSPKLTRQSQLVCTVFIVAVNLVYCLIFPVLVGLDFWNRKLLMEFIDKAEKALNFYFARSNQELEPEQENYIVDDEPDAGEPSVKFASAKHAGSNSSLPQHSFEFEKALKDQNSLNAEASVNGAETNRSSRRSQRVQEQTHDN